MAIFFQPPPQFVGGTQPFANHNLNPNTEAVPVNNPPPSHRARLAAIIALAAVSWQAPDPLPQQRRVTAPIANVAVATQPVYARPWLTGALAAWTPPDAAPQRRINLSPQLTAVRVDAPPLGGNDFNQPQTFTVLAAWQPPPPQPTQLARLNPAFSAVAVNNPPGILPFALSGIIQAWQPAPPAPQATRPTQISSVDQPPPRAAASLASLIQAWTQADPAIRLPGVLAALLPPPVVSQPPFVRPWLVTALAAWAPADPAPQQKVNLSPAFTAVRVDSPPGGLNASLTALVQSWAQIAPQVSSRPGVAATLPPAIVSVQPPPSTAWLATVLASWQTADPTPQAKRATQVVSIDPPPLGGNDFNQPQTFTALSAWIPAPPDVQQKRQTQIVSVDKPPFGGNDWNQPQTFTAIGSWQPPEPQPMQRVHKQIVSVVGPPVNSPPPLQYRWLIPTAATWIPPDPPPQQKLWRNTAALYSRAISIPFGSLKFLSKRPGASLTPVTKVISTIHYGAPQP